MGQVITYLIMIVIGVGAYYLFDLNPASPAINLQKKFVELGNMTGMHKNEIINKVGNANSISQIGDQTLLQWIIPGYHMCILFDKKGYFSGISSESFTA